MLDLFQNCAPVTFFAELCLRPQKGKQHGLLEDAEVFGQSVCIVDNIGGATSTPNSLPPPDAQLPTPNSQLAVSVVLSS